MFLKQNAFAVACCVLLHFSFVNVQILQQKLSKEEVEPEIVVLKEHSFVALMDLVFTDGYRRTCTGTIIHDYVVITAAHCFRHITSESIGVEMSASFVVIGSKKMFDTGYEQYLPMERILTHPKFEGWSADLALVYTFAAMTSDKPGRTIPLAGERTSSPVDSNVTVLSWGHCQEDEAQNGHISMATAGAWSDEESDDDINPKIRRVTVGESSKRSRQEQIPEHPSQVQRQKPTSRPQLRFKQETRPPRDLSVRYPVIENKLWNQEREERPGENKPRVTTRINHYLSSDEDRVDTDYETDRPVPTAMTKKRKPRVQQTKMAATAESLRLRKHFRSSPAPRIDNFYKNDWRRHLGLLENKLTVEPFEFVNMATCKRIVEGAHDRYVIKQGEVACYASENRYITDEDSGAPAVRRGHLVAVTVGGAQCDGDHVGVGMKMSCYCSWIAANLPGGAGAKLNCCQDCCRSSNSEDTRKIREKPNKYLF